MTFLSMTCSPCKNNALTGTLWACVEYRAKSIRLYKISHFINHVCCAIRLHEITLTIKIDKLARGWIWTRSRESQWDTSIICHLVLFSICVIFETILTITSSWVDRLISSNAIVTGIFYKTISLNATLSWRLTVSKVRTVIMCIFKKSFCIVHKNK